MRMHNYLAALNSLASAECLAEPFAAIYDHAERIEALDFWANGSHQRVALITAYGLPIGILRSSCAMFLSLRLNLLHTGVAEEEPWHTWWQECKVAFPFLENANKESVPQKALTCGEAAEPLERLPHLSGGDGYLDILRYAQNTADDLFLVKNGEQVIGTFCLTDALKAPAVFYILAMGLDLESATANICAQYPTTFDALKEKRRAKVIQSYRNNKPRRFKALEKWLNETGLNPSTDFFRREMLLATMMCDKREMLANPSVELGLSIDPERIRSIFTFCEQMRNYAVHPSPEFATSFEEAERLSFENHERMEPEKSDHPFSRPIHEELGITSISELATFVFECHELIDDLSRVLDQVKTH